MSLRLRVVAAIALVLAFASVVGAGLAGWQARTVLREELVAALAGGRQTAAGTLAALPLTHDRRGALTRLVRAFDGDRHLVASALDKDGAAIAVSRPLPVRPAPPWFSALFRPDVAPLRLAADGAWVTLAPVFANDVAALWREFLALGGVLAASFVAGAALMWLMVGRALRPLADFSAAFLRIGSGDYEATVREAGPLELMRLGRGVNEMAGRLHAMQAKTHALEDQLQTLQEEERADLARDLHDEIGPHLFAVKVDAAMARRLIGEGRAAEAIEPVAAIQTSVGHMQGLVRDILGRLRPTELIELGLAAAVDELVAFWRGRHPGIRFDVRLPADESAIGERRREALYRLIQEGLNNAVRHGRPGRVEVEITLTAGREVVARVSDDGAPSGETGQAGYGLIGMRERVAAAGGELTIARAGALGGWSLVARLPATDPALTEAA